jgi:hypothetical protein
VMIGGLFLFLLDEVTRKWQSKAVDQSSIAGANFGGSKQLQEPIHSGQTFGTYNGDDEWF